VGDKLESTKAAAEERAAPAKPLVPRHAAALGFVVVVGLVVGYAVIDALGFRPDARTAPLVIGVPVVLAILAQVIRDIRRVRSGDQSVGATSEQEGDRYSGGGETDDATPGVEQTEDGTLVAAGAEVVKDDRNTNLPGAVLWVLALAAMTYFLGMLISIPVFIGLFMRVFGRERWIVVVPYAAGMTAFVYMLFVYLLGVRLYQGVFGGLLPWP
jgi:hypothetical protein